MSEKKKKGSFLKRLCRTKNDAQILLREDGKSSPWSQTQVFRLLDSQKYVGCKKKKSLIFINHHSQKNQEKMSELIEKKNLKACDTFDGGLGKLCREPRLIEPSLVWSSFSVGSGVAEPAESSGMQRVVLMEEAACVVLSGRRSAGLCRERRRSGLFFPPFLTNVSC